MSYYRDQLEAWLKTIDVKADRVLDIGGSANPVEGRTKSWDVKEYKIMDDGTEEDFHAKWTEPDIVADITLETVKPVDGEFDVVFCLEVFEYVFDPARAISFIGSQLRSGGTLYISFPAIYPVHQPQGSDYLRYTRPAVNVLLGFGGVHINAEVTPRVATAGRQALADFYRLEGMRAVKNDDVIYDIGYMVKGTKK